MLLLETHPPEPDVDAVVVEPAVAAALGGIGIGGRRVTGVAQADRRAGCHRVLRTHVGPGGTTSWRMPPLPPPLATLTRGLSKNSNSQFETSWFESKPNDPGIRILHSHGIQTIQTMTMQVDVQDGVSLSHLKASGAFSAPLSHLSIVNVQNVDGKLRCSLTDGKENVRAVITSQVRTADGSGESRVPKFEFNSMSDYFSRPTRPSPTRARPWTFYNDRIGPVAGARRARRGPNPVSSSRRSRLPTLHVLTRLLLLSPSLRQVTKANPTLGESSLVRVTGAIYNDDGENAVLMITELDHIEAGAAAQVPQVKAEAMANVTNVANIKAEPNMADVKTPASQSRRPEAIKTPVSRPQPISTLTPYLHCWAIKAKVLSKGPIREFGKNKPNPSGQSQSVFSAELVDEEGTAIEATFWRDAADRYHEMLEEGKVYTFSRGSVKIANRNFNRTRNEYCLNFDTSASVEESADVIDASAMQTRLKFEKIDQLPVFVDKRAMIDVIGVVTSVGATGSIKRKADQQEVVRREVTLADDSLKTVSLTLWGEKAETEGEKLHTMLQAGQFPVLAVSQCRAGSYNGVTLSTSMRSTVMIDPDMSEAVELKTWYETTGATSTMSAVGEGLAAAKAAGAAKKRYFDLTEIQAKVPDSEDAKPFYATVNAVVASINPDQKMYYLACPENNRKVEQQGDGFYCEYDGKTYPTAVRRYVANARVMDASGIISASLFDEQATVVFGKTADRLHELREEAADAYKMSLNKASWQEWTFRVKAFASMWEGNLRKKYCVIDAKPVNFVAETRRTLSQLAEMA